MSARATLSVCMIVRDEADHIAGALAGVRPFADDIVVVDTGSSDATRALARDWGARLFDFPWCDDFAAARNESLKMARGRHLLWLDADDRIDDENAAKIQVLKQHLSPDRAFYFLLDDRRDGKPAHSFLQLRCVPNRSGVAFEGRIHERLDLSLKRLGVALVETDIAVRHYGYDDPSRMTVKVARNLRILEKEAADGRDDDQIHYYLAYSHAHLGDRRRAAAAMTRALNHLERQIHAGTEADLAGRLPFLIDAHLFLAATQFDDGRPAAALKHLVRVQALWPITRWAAFRLGCLLQRAGKHRQALAVLNQVPELPEPPSRLPTPRLEREALTAPLAFSLLHTEGIEAAAGFLAHRESAGAEGAAWEALGLLAFKSADFELSRACYERACGCGRLSADGWANFGLTCKAVNRREAARNCFRTALGLEPEHVPARVNLAYLEWQSGRPEAALSQFQVLVEHGRADLEVFLAYGFLGDLLGKAEPVELALQGLQSSPELKSLGTPPAGEILHWLAEQFERRGRSTPASWARRLAGKQPLTSVGKG